MAITRGFGFAICGLWLIGAGGGASVIRAVGGGLTGVGGGGSLPPPHPASNAADTIAV